MPYSTYTPETDPSSLNQHVLLVPNQHGETIAFADMPIGNLHVLSNHISMDHGVEPESRENEKTRDDYIYQFYLGSITVVGLFILFRFIQKS
jgi:hypothetical protein